MVTWPMTSRDPERSRSWPGYVWCTLSPTGDSDLVTIDQLTVVQQWSYDWLDEYRMFGILDSLKPTASGLDGLPAWFLCLGIPAFSKILADITNTSTNMSTVPRQWKRARSCRAPKKTEPTQPSDYRPVSVTAVLSRITFEKIGVRDFLYTALYCPPTTLSFADQFAFRPSGSSSAALFALLHTLTQALDTNPYVVVVALDFSEAFNTVSHSYGESGSTEPPGQFA